MVIGRLIIMVVMIEAVVTTTRKTPMSNKVPALE